MKIPVIKDPNFKVYTAAEATKNAIDHLQKRRNGSIKNLKTQWNNLNRAIGGGFETSTQYIIGAQSSVGKSAFTNLLLQSMFECNTHEDIVVVYFNFEMGAHQQIIRHFSSILGMTVQELKSTEARLSDEHFENMLTTSNITADYPIVYVDTPMKVEPIYDLLLWFRKEYQDANLIAVFDHTRLILSEKNQREMDMLDELSGKGVSFKNQYKSINLIISQLNRDQMAHDRRSLGFEPEITHIFGSSRVAQDANTIMLLHRPELYHIDCFEGIGTEDKLFLKLAKNRDGEVGMLVFNHQMKYNRIFE